MRKASLGTIFLTVFIDLLGFGMVIPFLPGVARHLGASDLVASLTGSVYSLMQFLLVPIWGRLSDRVGRRPILLISIAATAAGMALLGFANTLFLLFAARIFTGIATANIAVAQAYIADVTPPEGRARGMGLIGLAFGLGVHLRAVLRRRAGTAPPLRPSGRAAGLRRRWPVPDQSGAGKRDVARVAASRTAWKGHASPHLTLRSGRVQAALGTPDVGRALTINFLVVFWFAGMEQTFRLFTDDAFHMTDAATGGLFGLVGIVAAVVQGGLIGRLTRRFGEVRLLTAGLIIQTAGFAVLAPRPGSPRCRTRSWSSRASSSPPAAA